MSYILLILWQIKANIMERFTYKIGYTQNGADAPWYTINDNGEHIISVNRKNEAIKLCAIMNELNEDDEKPYRTHF